MPTGNRKRDARLGLGMTVEKGRVESVCGFEREMEVIEREEVSIILLRKMGSPDNFRGNKL